VKSSTAFSCANFMHPAGTLKPLNSDIKECPECILLSRQTMFLCPADCSACPHFLLTVEAALREEAPAGYCTDTCTPPDYRRTWRKRWMQALGKNDRNELTGDRDRSTGCLQILSICRSRQIPTVLIVRPHVSFRSLVSIFVSTGQFHLPLSFDRRRDEARTD
jgi:hypothetical protein